MFNVIDLSARRIATTEWRWFNEAAAAARAGIDVRLNLEEIEAIEMHTDQPQLRIACTYLLAEFSGARRCQ